MIIGNNQNHNDIICAISTAPGMGAIAVVRLSGKGSIALVDSIFESPSNKKLAQQKPYTVHFGKIMDGNTVKASFTVVVTGDTNGDGKTTITDMLAIKSHVLKKTTLSGASAQAADTSKDGGISITDFIQIKASILGKGTIVPN